MRVRPHFMLLTAFVSFSCLFDTRTPDNPAEPSANYQPPTEPSIVFVNLANAFTDNNVLNYRKSFADSSSAGRSFVFEPTSQAYSKYGIFLGWNLQSEEQYFSNIMVQLQTSGVASVQFTFTTQSVSTDSAFFEASYQLSVPHTKPGVSQTAFGHAQFSLIKDNLQNWVIWKWTDLANQLGDFTWSDMKGEFGQ